MKVNSLVNIPKNIALVFFIIFLNNSCSNEYLNDVDAAFKNANEETIATNCSNFTIKIPDCFGEKSKLNISLSNDAEWYCRELSIYLSLDVLDKAYCKEKIGSNATLLAVLDYYTEIRKLSMHSFARATNIEEQNINGNKTITAYLKGKVDSWSDEAFFYLHIIKSDDCFYCLQYIFPSAFSFLYDRAIRENIKSVKI